MLDLSQMAAFNVHEDAVCNDNPYCKKHSGNDGFADHFKFSHLAENEVGYEHSLCNGYSLLQPFPLIRAWQKAHGTLPITSHLPFQISLC